MATNMLAEQDRTKLDGIIQKMLANKESDANIQLVVNDFKKKYSTDQSQWQLPNKGFTRRTAEEIEASKPEEKRFLGRVGEDLSKRAGNVSGYVGRQGGIGSQIFEAPSTLAITAGQTAGGIFDIGTEGIKLGYETLVPEKAKETISSGIKNILETDVGKMGLNALKLGAEKYAQFKDKYPDSALELESILNIASLMPTNKIVSGIATPITKETKNIINKVGSEIEKANINSISKLPTVVKEKMIQDMDKQIDPIVTKGFSGTIGFKGKTTKQFTTEKADNITSVKTIIENKDKIELPSGDKLPITTEDWAYATQKSKYDLFNNELAPAIGATDEAGFKISVKNSINGLKNIKTDRTLIGKRKTLINDSDNLLNDLQRIEDSGGFTAKEAQRFITETNKEVDNFYKNPNPQLDTELALRVNIANDLRQGLDSAVDLATGEGIKDIKDKYKSLLSSEKQINQLRNREFKKQFGQNAPSYFDLGTDWALIQSALTGNIPALASTSGVKLLKAWQKHRMSPDTYITNMFKKAEPIITKQNKIKSTIPKEVRPTPLQIERTIYGEHYIDPTMTELRTGYPSITPVTTKAIEAPTTMYHGEIDRSGIPLREQYTPKEWAGIEEKMTQAYNNPEFWKNNADLTETLLKLKNREPVLEGKMNELLYRIMGKEPRKTSIYEKPQTFKSPLTDIQGRTMIQDPTSSTGWRYTE